MPHDNILITGGGGYIGCIMVPYLLDQGYKIRLIDRFLFGKNLIAEHPNLEKIEKDVRDLDPSDFTGIDYVIDMVAISNDASGERFQQATWDINWKARARCASLAKNAGVKRYILTSSCSIYGFQPADILIDEGFDTNPLTTYAKANENAEKDTLNLANDDFCVTVLRLATAYGLSPRMRYDLAINAMAYGAMINKNLPLMRDGSQWRPMVHIKDISRAHDHILQCKTDMVQKQIFNIGSNDNVFQIGTMAQVIADCVGPDVQIEYYGDPDHRSYRVNFDKISGTGFRTKITLQDGVNEILSAIKNGKTEKNEKTQTLDWYSNISANIKI